MIKGGGKLIYEWGNSGSARDIFIKFNRSSKRIERSCKNLMKSPITFSTGIFFLFQASLPGPVLPLLRRHLLHRPGLAQQGRPGRSGRTLPNPKGTGGKMGNLGSCSYRNNDKAAVVRWQVVLSIIPFPFWRAYDSPGKWIPLVDESAS